MKQLVIPERQETVPEARLSPKTIIVDVYDGKVTVVFEDEKFLFSDGVDGVDAFIEWALNSVKNEESLKDAYIEDVEVKVDPELEPVDLGPEPQEQLPENI